MNKPNQPLKHAISICTLLSCLLCAIPKISHATDAALWNGLSTGEYIALMRHALAPGTGDPSGLTIGDCNTQRNLSDEGREQAMRIGLRFRENGIQSAIVYSSQWCRCLETARLLELGAVQELPIINSFFQRFERREQQTQALREWIIAQTLDTPRVLVTHQVNISALTGVYTSSGEMVIISRSDDGAIDVKGTLETE